MSEKDAYTTDKLREFVVKLPKNAKFVKSSMVSRQFSQTKFKCLCCEKGTVIELPRGNCEHCGAVLALALYRGPCNEEGPK